MEMQQGNFLTGPALFQLSGFKRASKQAKWCRENGIDYLVRANGSLVVSATHVEQRMGATGRSRTTKNLQPNFSSFE